MTNQFGATSWDIDTGTSNFKKDNNKDLYLRLDQGSNIVRILTRPHEYAVHQFKIEGQPGFGNRVMASGFHDGRDYLVETYGSKPKRRWLVGVIDRKTGMYKLLDISKSVFDGIRSLVRDIDYGDTQLYDIDIKVDKQGGATGYYKIVPKPAKPLSAADLEIKQNIDLDDLKRRCTPPTYEAQKARVLSIIAKTKGSADPVTTSVVSQQTSAPTLPSDDEEDSFDFPAVG